MLHQRIDGMRRADRELVLDLYRRCHPGAQRAPRIKVRRDERAFVVRSGDQIIGFALVGYVSHGVRPPYGIVYELEIAAEADIEFVARSLLDTCREWLQERGTTLIYTMPGTGAPGFEPVGRQLNWTLDTERGVIRPEADYPPTSPSGLPRSIQAARQTWA